MIQRARLSAALVVLLVAAAGCSDKGTDPTADSGGGSGTGGTVSFAADIQPIFAMRCLVCHGVGGNAGLDLTANVAWAHLVGIESNNYAPRRLVMPTNPDSSVLYLKLNGDPGTGSRMPLGSFLSSDMIETVRLWIQAGALDN